MKRLKLFFACLLMAVLSIGQVWAADPTIANTDNSGTCVWTDGTATITQVKWAGSTAVNNTYASNPRVYGGHVLLFDAGEGNSWKSFEYTVATTYYGKSVVWGSSASEITSSNYSSATAGTGSLVSTSGGSSTLSFTANRYAYVYNSATSSPVQLRISAFTATYETSGGGDVIVKTLKSIAVSGQTTTYDQFAPFFFNGTCTATYSVTKNDVPQEDEQKVVTPTSVSSPDMSTTGEKTVTVSFTDNEVTKTVDYTINVNEHTVTPGTYDIVPNNAFWGTSYTGTDAAAADVLSGSQDDISIVHTKSGSNLYVNDSQTRAYSGHTMAISVPSGYVITDVEFTTGTWEGTPDVSTGDMTDSKTWEGSANSVTFTFTAKSFINNIAVTYEEEDNTTVKTLKSIAVSEMTTTYEVGDVFSFDGTCTATYSVTQGGEAQPDENKTVTPTSVSSPDMSTTGEKTITVTYEENEVSKSTTYDITVAEAPSKSTLDFEEKYATGGATADDGAVWTVTSDGTESQFDNTSGIHYGTNSAEVTYLQLATSDISGTISKVVVNARDAQANATITVTVGGVAFTCTGSATATNTSTNYTFTGSGSGEIVVRVERTESMTKAIYVKTIVVSYEADASAPAVTIDPTAITLATPDAANGTIDATYTNVTLASVTVGRYNDEECTEAFTGDWLTATLNDDKDIEYAVAANTGEARTAYIKLTAPASNGTSPDVVKVIEVSQAKAIPTYTSLDAVFAAAGSDETVKIVFDNCVITGKKDDNTAYLTDKENMYGLVIFTTGHGFNVGDVLNGTVQTTLCKYQGNSELKGLNSSSEGLTVSTGGTVTARVVSDPNTLTGANAGSVITINGSCTVASTKYYINGVQLFNTLYTFDALTDGDQYNCTGVFVMYNTTKEILPRSAADIEEIAVPTAVITLADVVLEKGQNITLAATITPAAAASAPILYSIVDGGSYVSLDGAVLTASEIGTAHILATVENDLPNYYGATKQITVTVNPVDSRKTAQDIDGFEAISGTLNADISFEAKRGDASNTPIIPSGKDYIRIYQNGGYLAVNAVKGCTIDEVIITIPSGCNSTTIAVGTDEDNLPTTGGSAATVGSSFTTGTGLNSQNVYLVCLGTTSSTRLEFGTIVVKYTGDPATVSSLALSGTYQTEFTKNATFNHDGVVVTATYSDDSQADVTTLAEFSDPDMSTIGQKEITVSYGGKSTSYNIEVVAATLTEIAISGTYPTRFNVGDAFSHAGMTVTATYSDFSEEDVTNDATFSGYNMAVGGIQTVTVEYGGQSAQYSIIVVPANTDVITADDLEATSTTYKEFTGVTDLGTSAVYAGKTAKSSEGAIQVRTSKSEDGIVVTGQNGTKVVKSVAIDFATVPTSPKVLQVYGKHTAYTSAADLFDDEEKGDLIGSLGEDGSVDCTAANYEFIGIRSSDGAMYLASVMVTWGDAVTPPTADYTRTVTVGNYGTICLPKAGTIEGASIFEIAYYGETSKTIFVDEITSGHMDAGVPYIFQATAAQLKVTYDDKTDTDVAAKEANGLHGFYDLENMATDNAAQKNLAQDDDNYILYNNQYWLVSGRAAYINNFRAYIKLSEIDPKEPALAPGRRRVAMAVNGENAAQGFENIESGDAPMKVMIDGTMYILRGEKVYDATGRLVK